MTSHDPILNSGYVSSNCLTMEVKQKIKKGQEKCLLHVHEVNLENEAEKFANFMHVFMFNGYVELICYNALDGVGLANSTLIEMSWIDTVALQCFILNNKTISCL